MQVLNFAFRIPKYSQSQLVNYLADEMDDSFCNVKIGKTPKASLTMHDYLFAFIYSPPDNHVLISMKQTLKTTVKTYTDSFGMIPILFQHS